MFNELIFFKRLALAFGAAAAFGVGGSVLAQGGPQTTERIPGISLPSTMVWSAYPTGTTGYAQAVGIGSVMRNLYGTSLRVLPGRNDVSRLEPLRLGRAQFAFGGTEGLSAQEGMRDFGRREWGPQPFRMLLASLPEACSFTLIVPRDSRIQHPRDLRGARVPYVVGTAAPNAGVEFLLRYANLTWNDVQRVEIGGFMAMVEAFVDGRLDVKWNACHSATLHRIANSPRGFRVLEFPHNDQAAVARVSREAPWFVPHVTRRVTGIESPPQGFQVFSTPYPILYTTATIENSVVHGVMQIMDRHHNLYREAAPGMEGWEMSRQQYWIENSFMPFHEGAILHFRSIGLWTDAAQRNQIRRLERQRVLQQAWEEYVRTASRDDTEFARGWMEARHQALTRAGQEYLSRTWPVSN
ncbi:MAG: TAXI family TRAP transporter solute-binding subunit [Clostridia bacterium]|nr:TAXI family TRAP transporter solute-binding subunit [Clostridia bacterium]